MIRYDIRISELDLKKTRSGTHTTGLELPIAKGIGSLNMKGNQRLWGGAPAAALSAAATFRFLTTGLKLA